MARTTRPNDWAEFTLTDGSTRHGFVYAVDPESGHVVLLQPVGGAESAAPQSADSHHQVTPLIVFGGSIVAVYQQPRSAACDRPESEVIRLTRSDVSELAGADEATVTARRHALRELLHTQHAPFEEAESGNFLVLGCLRISPPYRPHTCECENEIVLDRFLEMLAQVPDL